MPHITLLGGFTVRNRDRVVAAQDFGGEPPPWPVTAWVRWTRTRGCVAGSPRTWASIAHRRRWRCRRCCCG